MNFFTLDFMKLAIDSACEYKYKNALCQFLILKL